MSLYNLHYLEFMATSHDKFLSHPADITQRIFAPSRIGYPHAQKFHGTRLLLVIQKERPVRQSAHPMIAPAMLEDPRLPHGRRHTISTSSVSMSSCVFWSHGDGGNHSPSAGEISPFILADCRWSRTAGRLASGLPSGGGVTGRLSSAGTVLCTSILGGNVQAVGSKPDGSPWRVGIKDPAGDGNVCVLEISDMAVVTSGGYERYFEQDGETYHHIIDPATKRTLTYDICIIKE